MRKTSLVLGTQDASNDKNAVKR